jgi:hypothetical protein
MLHTQFGIYVMVLNLVLRRGKNRGLRVFENRLLEEWDEVTAEWLKLQNWLLGYENDEWRDEHVI